MSSLFMSLVAQSNSGAGAGVTMVILLIELAVIIVVIVGMWKVFEKAGKPGWAAIVPIYNIIVLLEIAQKPIWGIILFLIPLVNLIPAILVALAVAEKFGKSAAFGVGLILLPFVFYPILGFGDAQYQGGAVPQRGVAVGPPQ